MENDIIARAYNLAAECSTIDQVRYKLKREGYANVDAHLSSGRLRADLKTRLNNLQPSGQGVPRKRGPPAGDAPSAANAAETESR